MLTTPLVASLLPARSSQNLVMLGDPLQLRPTVRGFKSRLELSLMERLCMTLPEPVIVTAKKDDSEMDEEWIRRVRGNLGEGGKSYRKLYRGSLLLQQQYRMHGSIAAWSSRRYYNGLLGTPKMISEERKVGGGLVGDNYGVVGR